MAKYHPDITDLIGVKFVNGGRDKERGLDCWGLAREVFKRYNIYIRDYKVDAFSFEDINDLARKTESFALWSELEEPTEEDAPLIVLMRMHPNLITHVGVYIGRNKMIHTMEPVGAITTPITSIKSRIVGYYKHV